MSRTEAAVRTAAEIKQKASCLRSVLDNEQHKQQDSNVPTNAMNATNALDSYLQNYFVQKHNALRGPREKGHTQTRARSALDAARAGHLLKLKQLQEDKMLDQYNADKRTGSRQQSTTTTTNRAPPSSAPSSTFASQTTQHYNKENALPITSTGKGAKATTTTTTTTKTKTNPTTTTAAAATRRRQRQLLASPQQKSQQKEQQQCGDAHQPADEQTFAPRSPAGLPDLSKVAALDNIPAQQFSNVLNIIRNSSGAAGLQHRPCDLPAPDPTRLQPEPLSDEKLAARDYLHRVQAVIPDRYLGSDVLPEIVIRDLTDQGLCVDDQVGDMRSAHAEYKRATAPPAPPPPEKPKDAGPCTLRSFLDSSCAPAPRDLHGKAAASASTSFSFPPADPLFSSANSRAGPPAPPPPQSTFATATDFPLRPHAAAPLGSFTSAFTNNSNYNYNNSNNNYNYNHTVLRSPPAPNYRPQSAAGVHAVAAVRGPQAAASPSPLDRLPRTTTTTTTRSPPPLSQQHAWPSSGGGCAKDAPCYSYAYASPARVSLSPPLPSPSSFAGRRESNTTTRTANTFHTLRPIRRRSLNQEFWEYSCGEASRARQTPQPQPTQPQPQQPRQPHQPQPYPQPPNTEATEWSEALAVARAILAEYGPPTDTGEWSKPIPVPQPVSNQRRSRFQAVQFVDLA